MNRSFECVKTVCLDYYAASIVRNTLVGIFLMGNAYLRRFQQIEAVLKQPRYTGQYYVYYKLKESHYSQNVTESNRQLLLKQLYYTLLYIIHKRVTATHSLRIHHLLFFVFSIL